MTFQEEIKNELDELNRQQESRFPHEDCLKMDLHCHDYNSNIPDELLGRILNVPETWITTETLLENLQKNECNVFTITNHNNARSCFELQDKGFDILTGAEFSCFVPDFNVGIHVLAYGMKNEEEVNLLNKLRGNFYSFIQYSTQHDIPTIWAHPLYHYKQSEKIPFDFFCKMALFFERFEVLNGQRDTWQNMLVKVWLESLTEEHIQQYADTFGVNPFDYSKNPYKKIMTGGSDCHMGFFAGLTGSRLYIPNLQERLKTELKSVLALEAIRNSNIAPYGSHQTTEKLTISFLEYVCQIAIHFKDPGLMRILLHKGNIQDKIVAILVSNAFSEIKRHGVTMNFIKLFHESLLGKKAFFTKRLLIPKHYKPVFDDAMQIADSYKNHPNDLAVHYINSIDSICNELNTLLHKRLAKKIEEFHFESTSENKTLKDIIEKINIPSYIRSFIDDDYNDKSATTHESANRPNLNQFLDGLSFPFLASSLILAANYTSAKVLYNAREMLNDFSENIGKFKHPKRMLWLSDTFDDNNGVAMVLQLMHKEIVERNLPIDILICSHTVSPQPHLKVIKPKSEFCFPFYQQQPLRIPDFLEIQHIFESGNYDRIMCSTEGFMGLAALYLKSAFSVNAAFYLHTDWISFAKKVLGVDGEYLTQIRRMLRVFYKSFDSLFVLNSDQKNWLTSKDMEIDEHKIKQTAHWVDPIFYPQIATKENVFLIENNVPVLLFVGRISKEKGVDEIPYIYHKVKEQLPDLLLVIVGDGPELQNLKKLIPDAVFLGWADRDDLPQLYGAADLLMLPSTFDTFSCVVLEALACGLPVISYNTKGPKDIIQHNQCGFLVENQGEMVDKIIHYFNNPSIHQSFKSHAAQRADAYNVNAIIQNLLHDVNL